MIWSYRKGRKWRLGEVIHGGDRVKVKWVAKKNLDGRVKSDIKVRNWLWHSLTIMLGREKYQGIRSDPGLPGTLQIGASGGLALVVLLWTQAQLIPSNVIINLLPNLVSQLSRLVSGGLSDCQWHKTTCAEWAQNRHCSFLRKFVEYPIWLLVQMHGQWASSECPGTHGRPHDGCSTTNEQLWYREVRSIYSVCMA